MPAPNIPEVPGWETWEETLARKKAEAKAKAVSADEGGVEDKAVQKATTKGRKAEDTED